MDLRSKSTHPYTLDDFKNIIYENSSLRLDFGWSLESSDHLNTIMNDCIATIFPKYDIVGLRPFGSITSDLRCSWIGFIPFNVFEKVIFDEMDITELRNFNNNMIQFQIDIIQFITNHKIFQQHSLLRDSMYKFEFFKKRRKDPAALSDAFCYYIDAIRDSNAIHSISRDILEMEIGCHFLHNADLFFQLLDFSILKGTVHE